VSGLRKLGTLVERWEPPHAEAGVDGSAAASIAWPDVVGAEVARRTRSGRLRDGVLTVYTAGSTWSHQLTFLAPSIVAELNARCPQTPIRRLRFVVATGSTKALLDGAARRAGAAKAKLHHESSRTDADEHDENAQSAQDIVERLRRRQHALDRRRRRDGWMQCARCGTWCAPQAPGDDTCPVCADELVRIAYGRIERVLTNAPWLRRADVAPLVDDADERAYERVRRRLLARWEEQMFAAQRRLRRHDLHASDRVVAWSYLMLRTGMQQHVIGRAVIADALGDAWSDALAPTKREAPAAAVQKQQKTNPRARKPRTTT